MSIQARPSLWITAFQWLLFPASLLGGIAAMGYALHNHLAPEQAATAIPVFFMILLGLVERWLPWDPSWNQSQGDVKADLQSLVVAAFGLETLFKVAGPVAVIWVLSQFNLPPDWHVFPLQWPFWAQCVLVIGVIEIVKYWFHRMGHESPFWWPLHSIHHAVHRVYLLNGFRIHPLYHVMTYVLGYFPCIVLGAPPETLLMHTVILGICGSFQHCNVHLKFGVLNYIFSTNEIHRWHHSTRLEEGNKNYGAIFSIWDVVFGTYFNRPGQSPAVIGMVKERGYPINSYWKQLLIPFMYRRWVK